MTRNELADLSGALATLNAYLDQGAILVLTAEERVPGDPVALRMRRIVVRAVALQPSPEQELRCL